MNKVVIRGARICFPHLGLDRVADVLFESGQVHGLDLKPARCRGAEEVDGTGRWLRWQSPPVRTRAEWTEAWARAAQWARTPSSAERERETLLMPLAGWQLYYYRGGAWANAQSANTGASLPQAPGGLSSTAASIPEGVRLQLTLPEGGALAGVVTRDWANPLLGGGKS